MLVLEKPCMMHGDTGDIVHGHDLSTILNEFVLWGRGINREKNVIWVSSPPGSSQVGSSAPKLLINSIPNRSHLAGGFFFDRDETSRNSTRTFVPPIAYQLMVWNEPLEKRISKVLGPNPAILTARLEE
ncbi:hypothetical protein AX16_010770 [Volvariella volvacea WC 439]|nr:hypothetical protein AX16_010770 [Volvariella volvacea WC 439]